MTDEARMMIKSFFKLIAMPFSTHAADSVLVAEARDAAARVLAITMLQKSTPTSRAKTALAMQKTVSSLQTVDNDDGTLASIGECN
mmetsp:Transcript_8359/g.30301  ORF Transcript_8359/g.30301 Transcript_8359/m.30301 type:complete len:86 (-) Transcript_8359:95-352(-)